MTENIKASIGKDGEYRIHCGHCGKFLTAGEPKAIPEDLFGNQPRFPEGVPDMAGELILSVADAVCSEHGVVEKGAFWGSQSPPQ